MKKKMPCYFERDELQCDEWMSRDITSAVNTRISSLKDTLGVARSHLSSGFGSRAGAGRGEPTLKPCRGRHDINCVRLHPEVSLPDCKEAADGERCQMVKKSCSAGTKDCYLESPFMECTNESDVGCIRTTALPDCLDGRFDRVTARPTCVWRGSNDRAALKKIIKPIAVAVKSDGDIPAKSARPAGNDSGNRRDFVGVLARDVANVG